MVAASALDGANRVTQLTGALNGTTKTYVSTLAYAPHGVQATVVYGSGLTRKWSSFDFQLRPTEFSDQDGSNNLLYRESPINWSGNGNLLNRTITASGVTPFAQTFGYDPVNRLTSANEKQGTTATWAQNFSYDVNGNVWMPNSTLTSSMPVTNVGGC